jgi:hypothetical protein
MCMCGFCNVWLCVCVCFVVCGCVYVWFEQCMAVLMFALSNFCVYV